MEHCCHLGAESGLVGAEASIGVAVDNTNRGCPDDRVARPCAYAGCVGEVGNAADGRGTGVAIDHGDDLSARYGVVGSERRGGLAEGDSGVICPDDRIVAPLCADIGECRDLHAFNGRRALHAIEDGDEHCARHLGVRAELGGGNALHDAVLPYILNIGAAPSGLGNVGEGERNVFAAVFAADTVEVAEIVAGGLDDLGYAENFIAHAAVAALGAAVSGAGGCDGRSVDDLDVLAGNDRGNGELCLVGYEQGDVLKCDVIDHACESAAVIRGCGVLKLKSVSGAEGNLAQSLEELHCDLKLAAGKVDAAEVKTLDDGRLDPHVLEAGCIAVDLYVEGRGLTFIHGNVFGAGNIKLAADKSGDSLEESVCIKLPENSADIAVSGDESLEDLINLIGVDIAVAADESLEDLNNLIGVE